MIHWQSKVNLSSDNLERKFKEILWKLCLLVSHSRSSIWCFQFSLGLFSILCLKTPPIASRRITNHWTSNMTRYEFFNCVINPLTIFKQIAFYIWAIILAQVEWIVPAIRLDFAIGITCVLNINVSIQHSYNVTYLKDQGVLSVLEGES